MNNFIPNPDECISFLKINGCSKEVINHCKAVRDVAIRMAEKANANIRLVEAGALLHDIGRSKTHDIFHVIEGVKIAEKLGFSKELIKIIERHIGAGIPADNAVKLGLPRKDYIPLSLEEKIVCHSDNLIDNFKMQKIENEIEKVLSENKKDYAIRLMKLHIELSVICVIDVNKI